MSTITKEMLYGFIDSEKQADQEAIFQLWELPLKDRIAKKAALSSCTICHFAEYKGYKNIYYSQSPLNHSNFKIGEPIVISKNSPNTPSAQGTIIDIENSGALIFTCFHKPDIKENIEYTIDKGMIDLSKFQQHAILNNKLKNILYTINENYSNQSINNFQLLAKKIPEHRQMEFLQFNTSQQKAILRALDTQSITLIQGPPGTGKSMVTAFIASILCEDYNQKVLVSGPTHLSINNVLDKCEKNGVYGPRIYKIGKGYNCDGISVQSNINCCYKIDSQTLENQSKGIILGASPIALHTSSAKDIQVDTLIIDEAGQLNILLAAMAMVVAKRYIFIGDIQQMQPIIKANTHPKILNQSIMELLSTKNKTSMLNISYRMNQTLISFSSLRFYNNELTVHPNNANNKIAIDHIGENWNIINPKESKIFVDLNYSNTSSICEEEANKTSEIIQELIQNGIKSHNIAIVCPFKSQCRLIYSKLKDFNIESEILIDTVEKMQGQERDIIFYCWTISDHEYVEKINEFFFNPNRLNVAITRAKSKLITLGSSQLFNTKLLKSNQNLQLYYDFYKSCKIVNISHTS